VEAADHGKVVLSTILAGRKDLLQVALRHLQPAHFTDHVQQGIFTMCERYLDVAGDVLPAQAMGDALRANNQPPGTVLAYEEYYAYLVSMAPTEPDFRWSVEQLREQAAERMTGEALTQGMQVLRQGLIEGKQHYQGHKDARGWLSARLADIDRELHLADAPEGDMRTEIREIAAEYASRRQAALTGTALLSTSLPEVDAALGGGLGGGEFALLAAYTTEGKTSLAVQMAWHACTQGKNVIVFTVETLRSQFRVKVISRHSRLEGFGLPQGLNSRDIKGGTLGPDETVSLGRVVNDWTSNPAYGRLYVAQVPRGATVSTIEGRLRRISSLWPADLVIIDYLQLLRPEGRHSTVREAQGEIIKDAAQMGVNYMDGRGVVVVSPWQMGRKAREDARGGAGYTLQGLSETNEASATPDVILSLLSPDDYKGGRRVELKLQVLKGRDGERGGEIPLDVDFATNFFAARTGSSHDSLLDLEDQ
jgi:replicative DNA helicase